jgi:hypothetical protein
LRIERLQFGAGKRERVMALISKRATAAMVLGAAAMTLMTGSVHAITADLAKKCREMAIKAHPTMPAGSSSGYAAAQRSFFHECVEKNGNMAEVETPKTDGSATSK